MAERITIAIVGTGLIGPRHAKSVLACPDARLLCVVDPSPHAGPIAQDLGVTLYVSIEEMLRTNRPDAAIVCTPNSTHVDLSVALLTAGVHVLVEKPIATSGASAQHLIDVAQVSERQLLVGHHRRFNPYVTATKRALAESAIGRVIAVSGLWTAYKPDSYFEGAGAWRGEARSGGPILINLVHEVDILQYLLGPITRVHAEQAISQRGLEAEEGAAVLLRFESGVVGTFLLSDVVVSPHNFEGGTGENPMVTTSGKDFYRIFGSEGTLSVGDMKTTRYAGGQPKSWSSGFTEGSVPVGDEVPFDEQIKHLVNVVRGLEEPRCTGQDALTALMVCEAIRRALNCDHAVMVEAAKP
ncbi:hypothetical protein LTR53_014772 [Teratosphaeriaceae sp. CCFEE 6253]|nr:hypothetical protein LTR53_014772 [Teratosphaeriaceae sp. CCFEE 6253]